MVLAGSNAALIHTQTAEIEYGYGRPADVISRAKLVCWQTQNGHRLTVLAIGRPGRRLNRMPHSIHPITEAVANVGEPVFEGEPCRMPLVGTHLGRGCSCCPLASDRLRRCRGAHWRKRQCGLRFAAYPCRHRRARPTSTCIKAGASLTPSPTIATRGPSPWSSRFSASPATLADHAADVM